jgi:hypothetical protein
MNRGASLASTSGDTPEFRVVGAGHKHTQVNAQPRRISMQDERIRLFDQFDLALRRQRSGPAM